mmetsp:Transcript_26598/g.38123  ORF Transcript_26598/g.38123 Transcript_26598/m.38123 type:complete len:149 (+) Transcript_26598:81-527(+)
MEPKGQKLDVIPDLAAKIGFISLESAASDAAAAPPTTDVNQSQELITADVARNRSVEQELIRVKGVPELAAKMSILRAAPSVGPASVTIDLKRSTEFVTVAAAGNELAPPEQLAAEYTKSIGIDLYDFFIKAPGSKDQKQHASSFPQD